MNIAKSEILHLLQFSALGIEIKNEFFRCLCSTHILLIMIFTLIAMTNAFLSEPQSVMDNVDLRISKIYPDAANLDQL